MLGAEDSSELGSKVNDVGNDVDVTRKHSVSKRA
jgi:hypothetical protein